MVPPAEGRARELRLVTYLAPGLPLALFEAVARHLERSLGLAVSLTSDPTRSAPGPEEPDPFQTGAADVGFLCAPGYLWLAARHPPPVELVPAAFVFDDPRAADRPVYFADVVVARTSPARGLSDLRGARWVYNDPSSLSGYFSVLAAIADPGVGRAAGPGFFGSEQAVGSHHAALRAVESGAADLAAIDSNTLLLERRRGAARGVRVLASLGPFPIQPVVVRTALEPDLRRALAPALLAMHESEPARAALAACGVRRFAAISPAAYEPERVWLARADRARAGARCPDPT